MKSIPQYEWLERPSTNTEKYLYFSIETIFYSIPKLCWFWYKTKDFLVPFFSTNNELIYTVIVQLCMKSQKYAVQLISRIQSLPIIFRLCLITSSEKYHVHGSFSNFSLKHCSSSLHYLLPRIIFLQSTRIFCNDMIH